MGNIEVKSCRIGKHPGFYYVFITIDIPGINISILGGTLFIKDIICLPRQSDRQIALDG